MTWHRPPDSLAVNQKRVEHVVGQIPPDRTGLPVVLGRYRPSEVANLRRQCRPDDNGVEMARVVGEVDPLACIGYALDPARTKAAQESGQQSQAGCGDPITSSNPLDRDRTYRQG